MRRVRVGAFDSWCDGGWYGVGRRPAHCVPSGSGRRREMEAIHNMGPHCTCILFRGLRDTNEVHYNRARSC